jgi:hypothetical protein
MQRWTNTSIALAIALAYWLLDSTVHYAMFGEAHFELFPSEANELWMRTSLVTLVLLFGVYTDRHARRIAAQEAEKRITNHVVT